MSFEHFRLGAFVFGDGFYVGLPGGVRRVDRTTDRRQPVGDPRSTNQLW